MQFALLQDIQEQPVQKEKKEKEYHFPARSTDCEPYVLPTIMLANELRACRKTAHAPLTDFPSAQSGNGVKGKGF